MTLSEAMSTLNGTWWLKRGATMIVSKPNGIIHRSRKKVTKMSISLSISFNPLVVAFYILMDFPIQINALRLGF